MRRVIMLCLMTLFCIADADMSEVAYRVKESKGILQNCTQQLERLLNNTKENTVRNVENQRQKQIKLYLNDSNLTINAIRKEVEAAKAEGKDAQLCYNDTFNEISYIQDTLIFNSKECVKTANRSIESDLDFMNYIISAGNDLMKPFENIFPTCYNSNIYIMEQCINDRVRNIRSSINRLQQEVTSTEKTTKSATKEIVLQGTGCLDNVYSSVRSEVIKVKLAVTECLKKAPFSL